ncbi:MAG: carboxypeptidase regulatory-like domain-containing protein [Chitinophagaceae bacterium]|nr:MAG: carboxypeptidase regulatory-like domain-containing protein [Chitinophagaceae bacterium]
MRKSILRPGAQLVAICLTALLLGSCQKQTQYDENPGGGTPVQPVLPSPISATLSGTILDETGAAASGATVQVGTKTVSTDSRGFFRITGAALDKNQALVTATKSGYFKAYRTFAATSGANEVVIKLAKRNVTGTVDGAAGGTATLTNGSKVTLPANGVVDASSGAAYTGAVKVYASYIDPSTPDFGQTVPGSLMADDKDGQRVLLNSFAMLAVELEGAAGQKLQIKSGSQASLTFAIPTAAQASAPATIPLWYVDETSGLWKEQGTATKAGNTYVGTVTHFSFWNCDVPKSGVYVNFTLLNQTGQPLGGTTIRLTRSTSAEWNSSSYGLTDSLGQVGGMVPVNQAVMLAVMSPCGTVLYSQTVGPFSTATTVPPITVNLPAANTTIVTGTVLNCNGSAVTNGFVIVTGNNIAHYGALNASGQFSVSLISCPGAVLSVIGIDVGGSAQSLTSNLSGASGTVNAGNITACGNSSAQFITWTIDGGAPRTYSSPQDSLQFEMYPNGSGPNAPDWQLILWAVPRNGGASQAFYFNTFAMPVNGSTSGIATGLSIPGFTVTNDIVTFNFPTWPASIGEYLEGTLTGTFTSGGTPHSFTASYRLRRVN